MISIVMPVYNAGDYLSECMESILSQSYTNFELIIIDDGSTDQSVNILNSYPDKRIKLIKNEHNFIRSLNLGLERSSGKYIARMDSDDIMMPDRLQKQYDYMENNPDIDVCGSWLKVFGKIQNIFTGPTSHTDIVKNMLLKNTIYHPSVLLRRSSLFDQTDLKFSYKEEYIYAEDYKLWIDLIINGKKFAVIPETLLKYRVSDTQMTNTKKSEMWRSTIQAQFEYVYYIANMIAEEAPEYLEVIENLIDLYNDEKIDFRTFQHSIYGINMFF